MSFLYFVEGRGGMAADDLGKVGLGYLAPANTPARSASNGPGGKSGVTFAVVPHGSDVPQNIGFYPNKQTWTQIPGTETWLGYVTDAPPGPKDLLRDDAMGGHTVRLEDGNEWHIPVACYFDRSTPFPRKVKWTADGWEVGGVAAKYEQLYGLASEFWDKIFEGKGKDVTINTEINVAALALGLNYRIGPPEIAALELLTTFNTEEIVKKILDMDLFLDFVKKNQEQPDEQPLPESGSEDSSPDTSPPSPNSELQKDS